MTELIKDSKSSAQISDNKSETNPTGSPQKKKVVLRDQKINGFFQNQGNSHESLKSSAQNSESKLTLLDEATV